MYTKKSGMGHANHVKQEKALTIATNRCRHALQMNIYPDFLRLAPRSGSAKETV